MERQDASSGRASESVSNLTVVRVSGRLLVVSRDQLAGLLQGAGG